MKAFILFNIFAFFVYLSLKLAGVVDTFNIPVRLVAGGHCGKQEKNSLVRTFRMVLMNRFATITTWTDLWQVYMLCSLIGISLSAISQKTSRCKLKLNKLFPLAVFLQKGFMPGTTQKTHER